MWLYLTCMIQAIFLTNILVVPCLSFTMVPLHMAQRIQITRVPLDQGLQMGRTPEISDWQILPDGSINGVSKYHPMIEDGDDITTSPLADVKAAGTNRVVRTKSGSLYKLVGASAVPINIAQKNGAAKPMSKSSSFFVGNFFKANEPDQEEASLKKVNGFSLFGATATENKEAPKAPSVTSRKKIESPSLALLFQRKTELPSSSQLSGLTIGNGKYLLVGQSSRSTSGKSQIWTAYRSDSNGAPKGDELTVKLSANYDALKREDKNYEKITSNIISRGRFVEKFDFLDYAQANARGYDNFSALVIEKGVMDLKELLAARAGRGLTGKAMRDAAASAGQCIQAMHLSKMVWTDLKTENFVTTDQMEDIISSNGGLTVKGIDLESARAFGRTPVDYSPEACPPEFAEAFLSGNAMNFAVGPKYDMWSLGMMLFELSTGRPYFFRKSPTIITTTLRNPSFQADVSSVEDPKLRDLISRCLQTDPRNRPSIAQFLIHPFFTTTGIGPISF